jgi:hypothetical protein
MNVMGIKTRIDWRFERWWTLKGLKDASEGKS